MSYSGGADALNIRDLLKTGVQPITMATTILKPGGYPRFKTNRRSIRRPFIKRI